VGTTDGPAGCQPDTGVGGFALENVHPHFQFGRFQLQRHAPRKARNQSLFHVFQAAGELVAGQDNLLVARMEMLKQ